MSKEEKLITNKQVKSSAFAAYFGEPKNAARLFEALEPGVFLFPPLSSMFSIMETMPARQKKFSDYLILIL